MRKPLKQSEKIQRLSVNLLKSLVLPHSLVPSGKALATLSQSVRATECKSRMTERRLRNSGDLSRTSSGFLAH